MKFGRFHNFYLGEFSTTFKKTLKDCSNKVFYTKIVIKASKLDDTLFSRLNNTSLKTLKTGFGLVEKLFTV